MFWNKLRLRKIYLFLISLLLTGLFVGSSPAQAQEPLPQDLIREVGFDQELDAQLPLELPFIDSTGRPVHLGDYFNKEKPVILSLGYYECPMLCTLVRNGLFESLQALEFTVGEEFEVVIVSIDPDETPEIAENKRRVSMMSYGRSMADEGWNFLLGEEEAIKSLADTIGFKYTYDPNIDEYVHPSGIVIVTPQGRVSKYLYGIDYPALDLRLALVEAAANNIGSPVDQLLLTCYHYDPAEGKYTLFITNIIRMLGIATVVVIGLGLSIFLYRERHQKTTVQSI
ncbi:SCO family protein [Chloroflexota bacterium]